MQMMLPVAGGVRSSSTVSVLALNADAQPDGCPGNPCTASPGASVAFQLVGGVQFLLETFCVVFTAGTPALEAPAVQEAKQRVFFNVCPRAETTTVEKKKEKKSFMGLGFTFLSGG